MKPQINPRARTREDRAGDPLDGLVNLFDLGIVLAVAFLLAALSSIDLAPSVLQQNASADSRGTVQVPADSVVAEPGQEANTIDLQPGERVVGQGEPVGTVYRLDDGRTVIVRPEDEAPVPGEQDSGSSSSGSSNGSAGDGGAAPPADDDDAAGSSELPPVPQPQTGAP